MKRIILEMGTGNDLYGEDYTKAACRAVDDALHHSSLTLFRSLGFDHADMEVRVTCLLYTSPSPRDGLLSRMPSSA